MIIIVKTKEEYEISFDEELHDLYDGKDIQSIDELKKMMKDDGFRSMGKGGRIKAKVTRPQWEHALDVLKLKPLPEHKVEIRKVKRRMPKVRTKRFARKEYIVEYRSLRTKSKPRLTRYLTVTITVKGFKKKQIRDIKTGRILKWV